MNRWLVTRHPGAQAWLRQRGIDAAATPHLDVAQVAAGDEIYGTLPLHLAAEVCMRGARLFHLAIDLPPALRGQEIPAEDMGGLNARLEEYRVQRV
ncbi:CRISPR-associated protein Csx16 [Thermomonas fusca]